MVQRLDVVPGVGIDFGLLGEILLVALGLYVVSSLLLWWQGYLLNGAVQRSIYRMRNEVQTKINRLPLSYFDRSPRGELLSRVTNDIDNISQALQQTLSQLLTSLLTVVGVVIMMFVVSPTAGPDRLDHHPGLGAGDRPDRQAGAEAVRRPVADDR